MFASIYFYEVLQTFGGEEISLYYNSYKFALCLNLLFEKSCLLSIFY